MVILVPFERHLSTGISMCVSATVVCSSMVDPPESRNHVFSNIFSNLVKLIQDKEFMAEDFKASQSISVALAHQISWPKEPLGRDSSAAQAFGKRVEERFQSLRKVLCL